MGVRACAEEIDHHRIIIAERSTKKWGHRLLGAPSQIPTCGFPHGLLTRPRNFTLDRFFVVVGFHHGLPMAVRQVPPSDHSNHDHARPAAPPCAEAGSNFDFHPDGLWNARLLQLNREAPSPTECIRSLSSRERSVGSTTMIYAHLQDHPISLNSSAIHD